MEKTLFFGDCRNLEMSSNMVHVQNWDLSRFDNRLVEDYRSAGVLYVDSKSYWFLDSRIMLKEQ